jgi:hypothetical protein
LGSRRLSKRAMDSRTGPFAIQPLNRIFMTPMDFPCCLIRQASMLDQDRLEVETPNAKMKT